MPDMVFERALEDAQDRPALVEVLQEAVENLAERAVHALGAEEHAYVAGTGYDFTEFAAVLADKVGDRVGGVACLWTERCEMELEGGEDAFALAQEFVEPVARGSKPTMIVCASVIADKLEVLRILMRLVPTVRPERIMVVAGLMNQQVESELAEFLNRHFPDRVHFRCHERTYSDIRSLRTKVAAVLDDREVKIVPLMSEWLLDRRFGPRPIY